MSTCQNNLSGMNKPMPQQMPVAISQQMLSKTPGSAITQGNPITAPGSLQSHVSSPSLNMIMNMKQTLENLLAPSLHCTTGSANAPVTPTLFVSTPIALSILQQSLNNGNNGKIDAPTDIQGAESSDGLPEGTYAALSFALSVAAGAIAAVSATIGENAARVSEMDAITGKGEQKIYEVQEQQAQQNLDKQTDATHHCKILHGITQHLGQISSAAMIVAGVVTGDPALVVIGMMMLAMSINVVSSELVDGLAAGLVLIPGMEGRETLAHGLAEGIILAATVITCVVVGNVAGAEEAVGEAAFTDTGEALDTSLAGAEGISGGASPSAVDRLRIGLQQIQSGIGEGMKTMGDLMTEARSEVLQFFQETGATPARMQEMLSIVKNTTTVGKIIADVGLAGVEVHLAFLSKNYGQIQGLLQNLDFNFDVLSQRNQMNLDFSTNIVKENFSMVSGMFNSAAQAEQTIASSMYQA